LEKEVVFTKNKGFEVRDMEAMPTQVADGDIIVRPLAVGICGSDLNFIETLAPDKEIFLGHEWVGEVAVTSSTSKYMVGDLVSSGALIGCGQCKFCQEDLGNLCNNGIYIGSKDKGMLRTWASLPERALLKMDRVADYGSLTLLEVAAVGDESMNQLSQLSNKKEKLLVLGAGPVGLFTALRAKREGYTFEMLELEPFRLKSALKLGLPARSLGEWLMDKKSHHQFDLIVDCSGDNGGTPGLWKYLPLFATIGTKLVVVGKYSQDIKIDPRLAGTTCMSIKWTRGLPKSSFVKTIEEWKSEIQKLGETIVSHRFPIDQISEAFVCAQTKSNALKVVIEIN